jgi:GNAT superfamily N-acetyltransferase
MRRWSAVGGAGGAGAAAIRHADVRDLEHLREIERAAGEAFRGIGMAGVADDEPYSVAELAGYLRAGLAFVAVDGADVPVAYLVATVVDGDLHVEQVSVHPGAARRGIGRALVAHVARYGRERGFAALTLTTFAGVPWNAPYYARLGFRTLSSDETGPGLREVRRREAAHGLDRWPRVCMRLPLG